MHWLSHLLGKAHPALTPEQAKRLDAWQALPPADLGKSIADARYVVVDAETSGLNLAFDRLIAIGAVAVSRGRIALSDSMEIVLQQDKVSDKSNILIHGISGDVQREGVPPAEALLRFLEYVGKDPLIAFHVTFDSTMIGKAMRKYLGLKFEPGWVDLAHLAPALCPELQHRNCSLDYCTGHFGIGNFSRHSALADALATAELLLALRPRMAQQQVNCYRKMRDVYLAHRRAHSLKQNM